MKKFLVLLTLILLILQNFIPVKTAYADTLSDSINEQINILDFDKLEDFYNDISANENFNITIKDKLNLLLNGEYTNNFNDIINLLFSSISESIKDYLPLSLSIIAILFFSSLISNIKSNTLAESTQNIINLICSFAIIILLYKEIYLFYSNTKNIIENIAKLNEIISPIIVTLMVATKSNASASIYTPQTALLTNVITGIFIKIILPLVVLMTIFSVINDLGANVKFNTFIEFISSLIKWIIGISFTIFAIFITTQGLSASIYDGVSIKAAKYAISNSIPLVGGFLKDGFDILIAGSVLIKNAIGIVGIIIIFSIIFNPIIKMVIFSLILKLSSAIIDVFSKNNTTCYIKTTSKCISYFSIVTIISGFMFFLTILLSILTANAFI